MSKVSEISIRLCHVFRVIMVEAIFKRKAPFFDPDTQGNLWKNTQTSPPPQNSEVKFFFSVHRGCRKKLKSVLRDNSRVTERQAKHGLYKIILEARLREIIEVKLQVRTLLRLVIEGNI